MIQHGLGWVALLSETSAVIMASKDIPPPPTCPVVAMDLYGGMIVQRRKYGFSAEAAKTKTATMVRDSFDRKWLPLI